MGFAESFEKSFVPAAGKGADMSLELMKEKIKKNENARQSGAIVDSMKAKILMNAEKNGGVDKDGMAMLNVLENLKVAGVEPSNLTTVAKMLTPESFVDEGVQAQRDSNKVLRESTLELRQENRQDKLEKFHTDRLTKVLSNRTGGLGLQDNKVNQALDLRTMVDGMQDQVTGEYKIPPAAHTELALGVAKLLSPTGVAAEGLVERLEQGTLQQKMANVAIFYGFDPKQVGGTTQSVAEFMIKTIDRQGEIAETIRDKYMDGLKKTAPKGLDPDTVDNLNKIEITSSFKDYMKTRTGVSTFNIGGKKYVIPADQVEDFKKDMKLNG